MIIPFDNVGQHGVIEDVESHELPAEAWSSAVNVRFNDGHAEKSLGHSEPFGTPSIVPYQLFPEEGHSNFYWIYAGLNKIYSTDGTTHANITRQINSVDVDYNAIENNEWIGGDLGGITILNNGIDTPQMHLQAGMSTKLEDLSNWPADSTASVVRPFKNFLVGIDWTESGARNPYLIRWSHPADPGFVPNSWDYTDTTKDAGRTTISMNGGFLVDCGPLRDSFIIYGENSTQSMRFIGGQNIFQFRELFADSGIFSRRCWADFDGKHCVLTGDDIIVHDGVNKQSIGDAKVRNTLFTALRGATNSARTYLRNNQATNEIWICYPEGSDEFPTKALIWNYRHNTFGYRALPGAMDINFNVVDPSVSSAWASASYTWANATGKWGDRNYSPAKRSMLIADTTNTKLLQADDTNQFSGTSFTATLERQGLAIVGRGRDGQSKVDMDVIKRINRIIPHFSGSGTVNVYLGTQDVIGGAITYGSAMPFVIGTDRKIDARSTARIHAIKFESTGDTSWQLHKYDLDLDIVGKR